jgi:hypothetical protein
VAEVKRACLIYVSATASSRVEVRAELEANGFDVCEVEAKLEDALAAQAANTNLPQQLVDCINSADLCVVLLPESAEADALLGPAAALASEKSKRLIGVVAGSRSDYPEAIDDTGHALVREHSPRLKDAICGAEIWEGPDGAPVPDRKIKHVRCQ